MESLVLSKISELIVYVIKGTLCGFDREMIIP